MSNKQKKWILIGLLAIILVGILMMIYPLFSAWYSEQVSSEVHSEYAEAVETVDTSEIDAELEAAHAFNKGLVESTFDPLIPEENGYYDILDLTQSGIMGYIDIPSIDVSIPIYHGTSDRVLKLGAGHMPNTSFPVGGVTTHAVITAHSGMASNPMFSDIVLLDKGDIFQIEVLGEVLTYEIQSIDSGSHSNCSESCDIKIVEPANIDNIKIIEGEDLCTLVTCYPFGINSHRYLVRGHRIPTPEEIEETFPVTEETEDEPDKQSVWRDQYWQSVKIGLTIAVLIVTALVVYLTVRFILAKKKRGRYE